MSAAAGATAAATARPRLFAPEVIQTSAMDCGPAALKSLLEGFGVPVSYGRLREACQTEVDGTSIDTLESVAGLLGLEAEQIMLPVEHLLLPEAGALPALVVVTLPSGLTHFVVVWRTHGPLVQVMDPGRGRRWVRRADLLREVYRHEASVPAAAWREWAGSSGFLEPLRRRLAALIPAARAAALVERAAADPGWAWLAALEAAVRAAETLAEEAGLSRREAGAAFERIWASLEADGPRPGLLAGPAFWSVRAEPPAGDGAEALRFLGAVLLHVAGRRAVAPEASEPMPPGLAAALGQGADRPGRRLVELLRADGAWRWSAIAAALVLAGAGTLVEALFFRGLLDLGRRLGLFEQRVAMFAALCALAAAIFLVEWSATRALWQAGRRLERRLREAFLRKIPRLGDRYFQSRPVSDMVERAHLAYRLRLLPGVGGLLARVLAELVMTGLAIALLDPPSAPIALAAVAAMVVVPLAFQPLLTERDLRMRAHAGGLSRFYLDALLGLVAIRAHGAETALVREHHERLGEWARAARASASAAVWSDGIQLALGYGLAAWFLAHYLIAGPGSGWALLILYWALNLPALGQELIFLIQQLPVHRNVTLRLLEPLGAPAAEAGPLAGLPRSAGSGAGGVEVAIEDVRIERSGHDVLAVDRLHLPAGAHVAIVGASGAGKSSLVGLLLGFHEPAAGRDGAPGRVLVDGQPLDGDRLARLRTETIWAEPGVYLWNRPLLDNVRYGGEPPGRPVGEAIRDADLESVLTRLPMGLQTSVGEGGALLSGGQGQRVRFARGVHRGPARLVVLDEAFRGLERPLREALLGRARHRWRAATLIYVTHDLAEAARFPRVLVIEGGRVIEDGAPETLAARAGSRYRELLEGERRARAALQAAMARHLEVEAGRVREVQG